jgi:excisionase family DNA binding protein
VFQVADEAARASGRGVSADDFALGVFRAKDASGATVLRELGFSEADFLAPSGVSPGPSIRARRGWGPELQPIIQAAAEEAWRFGSRLTRSAHVVLGLAASGQGTLFRLLAERGVNLDALRERVKTAVASTPEPAPEPLVRAGASPGVTDGIGQAFFTVDQAAQFLGIHHQTLRGYIRSGKLPAYRLAGEKVLRIKREDLMALLEPVSVADVEPDAE